MVGGGQDAEAQLRPPLRHLLRGAGAVGKTGVEMQVRVHSHSPFHDDIDRRRWGIRPVRGMELDCAYHGWDIHLLAYGFRPDPVLTADFIDKKCISFTNKNQILGSL